MAEEKINMNCPKCKSAALGAVKTRIPTSPMYGNYVRLKCLNCGTEFDLVERS